MWIHFKAYNTEMNNVEVCFHTSQVLSIACKEFGSQYKIVIQFTHQTTQEYIIYDWNVYADMINSLRKANESA